jgi:F-type H+-transporting ATPase subunit gamma
MFLVCSAAAATRCIFLVVCTAERGLCGAFNSSIARLARETAASLIGQGKTVKILCVGKKGLRRPAPAIRTPDHRSDRSARFAAHDRFRDADAIGRKIIAFKASEFDVCTLFFSRFKSVISQIPTAQQIIPPICRRKKASPSGAAYDYEPDEEEILRNCCRATFRADLARASRKCRVRNKGRR